MVCNDAVLHESLLKAHTVNCLTHEQNTKKPYKDNPCFFRALALLLHGNDRLKEETGKLFNLFLINSTDLDPSKFQGVCMDEVPYVEDIVGINIFIYDIDILTAQWLGNLHDEALKSTSRMFSCYDITVLFVT